MHINSIQSPNRQYFRDCLKEKYSPGRHSLGGWSFCSWGPAAKKLLSPNSLCIHGIDELTLHNVQNNQVADSWLHLMFSRRQHWIMHLGSLIIRFENLTSTSTSKLLTMSTFSASSPPLPPYNISSKNDYTDDTHLCYLQTQFSYYLPVQADNTSLI